MHRVGACAFGRYLKKLFPLPLYTKQTGKRQKGSFFFLSFLLPIQCQSCLHFLARLGEVILAFVTQRLEQLVLNLLAFGAIHFDILAPLRHVMLVVSRLCVERILQTRSDITVSCSFSALCLCVRVLRTIRRAMRGMSHELPGRINPRFHFGQ